MVVKPTEQKKDVKHPVKVFRSGGVKATIWDNEFTLKDGTTRKSHSVTIVRSYKDAKTDEWKETNSYNVDSLSDLESVSSEARKFLKLKDQ